MVASAVTAEGWREDARKGDEDGGRAVLRLGLRSPVVRPSPRSSVLGPGSSVLRPGPPSSGPRSSVPFRAANEALATLDPDQASLYLDLLYRTMGPALFRALEDSMIVSKPYGGLFEKYYREGTAEGKAEGLAEALMRVLAARSLTPSPQQRSTILACVDPRRVERWIERALCATSVEEALREE